MKFCIFFVLLSLVFFIDAVESFKAWSRTDVLLVAIYCLLMGNIAKKNKD